MAYEDEFNEVKNAPAEKKLLAFRTYCENQIARHDSGEFTVQEAAYRICGTGFQALKINGEQQSIVSDILDQACDLELPVEHRSVSSSWEKLVGKVRELPGVPSDENR